MDCRFHLRDASPSVGCLLERERPAELLAEATAIARPPTTPLASLVHETVLRRHPSLVVRLGAPISESATLEGPKPRARRLVGCDGLGLSAHLEQLRKLLGRCPHSLPHGSLLQTKFFHFNGERLLDGDPSAVLLNLKKAIGTKRVSVEMSERRSNRSPKRPQARGT